MKCKKEKMSEVSLHSLYIFCRFCWNFSPCTSQHSLWASLDLFPGLVQGQRMALLLFRWFLFQGPEAVLPGPSWPWSLILSLSQCPGLGTHATSAAAALALQRHRCILCPVALSWVQKLPEKETRWDEVVLLLCSGETVLVWWSCSPSLWDGAPRPSSPMSPAGLLMLVCPWKNSPEYNPATIWTQNENKKTPTIGISWDLKLYSLPWSLQPCPDGTCLEIKRFYLSVLREIRKKFSASCLSHSLPSSIKWLLLTF